MNIVLYIDNVISIYIIISFNICMVEKENLLKLDWVTVERPGYFGKRKEELFMRWNKEYGEGNWRIVHQTKDGEIMEYENVFWKVYVSGYVRHFLLNPDQAEFLVNKHSYTYDKYLITRREAFDPYAFYNKPGIPNQFHHTSLNIALEWFLGMKFKGSKPIQVRQGKPGTDKQNWPAGWRWSPGYIRCTRPDQIPIHQKSGWWEDEDSIEAFYQYTKVVQARK